LAENPATIVVYGLQLRPPKPVTTGLSPLPTWLSATLAILEPRPLSSAALADVDVDVASAFDADVLDGAAAPVGAGVLVGAAVLDGAAVLVAAAAASGCAVSAKAGCASANVAISAAGTATAVQRSRLGGASPGP
jgi:hypothetical protein